MMENVENAKLDHSSLCQAEQKVGMQRISAPDNSVQGKTDEPENFVIDMNNLSYVKNTNSSADSIINLQRGFSRKMPQYGSEILDKSFPSSSSPRVSNMMHNSGGAAIAGTVQGSSPRINHQITITTSSIKSPAEKRGSFKRRGSIRRSSRTWILNPRNILVLCATLSSMGTIVLIFLTLSVGGQSAESTGSIDLLQ